MGNKQPCAKERFKTPLMMVELGGQHFHVTTDVLYFQPNSNQPSDGATESELTHEWARDLTLYLPKNMETDADITILAGLPFDNSVNTCFILCARVHKKSPVDGNLLHHVLSAQLKRGGQEVRRFGGSSGRVRLDQAFFDFLHRHGSTPRQSRGLYLQPAKEGRAWDVLYRSPYGTAKIVKCQYSPPVKGGQVVRPEKLNWNAVPGYMEAYGSIMAIFPRVLSKINFAISKSGLCLPSIAQTALADEMQSIDRCWNVASGSVIAFLRNIANSHTITVINDAMGEHRDVPGSKSRKTGGDYSFLEYKYLFEVSQLTNARKNTLLPLARLRGGAGHGKAVSGKASHTPK